MTRFDLVQQTSLTVLHDHSPARDVAAGPCGEAVGGGRHTHGLHQVIEEDGAAELQQGDVVVGGELVVLRVDEDAPDISGGCSVVGGSHHPHSHVGLPRTSI